jgi:hypothetical protein
MGEVISICMKEIFDADILFLKNDFILRGSNNNFSYILWYNKSNERIIVGKSRLNSMTTSIEYLTSYNGIDDYYKKDLCKNKEHLKYFADGLFDEVYKFFEKNNKTEILEMLNEEKRIHIDKNAQIAQSVEQGTENPRVGGSIPPLGTIMMQYLTQQWI